MSNRHPDFGCRSDSEPFKEEQEVDCFEWVPDCVMLLIFNRVADVKTLGRCGMVSRRFGNLVSQVDNVVVKVDRVSSGNEKVVSAASSEQKSRGAFSSLSHIVYGGIVKPLQALGQVLGSMRSGSEMAAGIENNEVEKVGFRHHSLTQVLMKFTEIRFLRIDLPSDELDTDDGVLLKWRAEFGSTLDKCVILGASSIVYPGANKDRVDGDGVVSVGGYNGWIPEFCFTKWGLKSRVSWAVTSLVAVSARHYLLHPTITEHRTLDSLVLSVGDGQGVMSMNKYQLEESRVKPLVAASSAHKRTVLRAMTMRLWHAASLELPDGVVLKGATLFFVRPCEQPCDLSWVADTFEEPYGTAVRLLMKHKVYCLNLDSF